MLRATSQSYGPAPVVQCLAGQVPGQIQIVVTNINMRSNNKQTTACQYNDNQSAEGGSSGNSSDNG